VKKVVVTSVAAVLLLGSAAQGVDFEDGPSRYLIRSGNGIPKLVVKGKYCLTSKDSAALVLVAWEPHNNRAVYRCRRP